MVVQIEIDGTEESVDLAEILTIREPESERMVVSVSLAYWGAVFGAKLEAEELADANYRAWHGETISKLLDAPGEKSPAEWKVKAVIEASPGFLVAKQAIAKSKREVATAKAIFDAFSRKADILARLIARENTEHIRSGDVGRTAYDSPASEKAKTTAAKEDRTAKVAAAISKTKSTKV